MKQLSLLRQRAGEVPHSIAVDQYWVPPALFGKERKTLSVEISKDSLPEIFENSL